MTKVFVYGTLKRGHGANGFLSSSKYEGEATIRGAIYHLGGFPGYKEEEQGLVHGEVYLVDDDTLHRLDRYEGYNPDRPGHSLYLRKEKTTEEGELVSIYVYNGMVTHNRKVEDGRWS